MDQPFKQQAGQVPTGVENRSDVDTVRIESIHDAPRPLDQLPVDEHADCSQFGNDAAAIRQGGESLAPLLHLL